MRFLYYWLDFVAGYWLQIHLRKAQTTLVVGERYFPDVLVHPERYGFAVPNWLMRLAAACVPSPDLTILLDADPEVIHARKAELTPATLAAQLAAYESELRHWGKTVTVQTDVGTESVAQQISELILEECARRTAGRLEKYDRRSRWRAFPSRGQPKIWVSDRDTVSNALHLLHPFSPWARVVKATVTRLPEALTRPFTRSLDAGTAERLESLSRTIRTTLGREGLAVSFCTGTPGLHRKLTAQASERGNIISYVKIADDEATAALLSREVEMIAWLEGRDRTAAVVPRVLSVESCGPRRLLFLSAPPRPGTRRPLQPDEKDGRFLRELAALGSRTIATDEALDAMDFDVLIGRVRAADPSAANALNEVRNVISKVLATTGVRVVACHGDYAPWNTLELRDGSLYVFDWEYGSTAAPALTDLFHRVLMPCRLVLHHSPEAIVDRLLELHRDPALAPVFKESRVEPALARAYLLLYLVGLAAREVSNAGTVGAFLAQAIRRALEAFPYPVRRQNVLVAAYACEPGGGSEPGVGWNMCEAISRDHNVWVITRRNNRERIEKALAQCPNPNLHFHYADLPYWARFWKKGGRGIRTYYYLWQFAALREAWLMRRSVRFDLAHHVTFVNNYVFTFLGLLPTPFVWGPIGSHPILPRQLTPRWTALVRDRARHYAQVLFRAIDPLFLLCVCRARLIIGINPDLGRRFPVSVFGRQKFLTHTAIGVEYPHSDASARTVGDTTLRILSVGRLVPLKGFHLAIRAFSRLVQRGCDASLTIVGEGPDKRRLQKLAAQVGVDTSVEFIPWLPRSEVLAKMGQADVFCFPASKEGAWSCSKPWHTLCL